MLPTSLQFDMEDPFHGQLTDVTKYPLTSIPWPYCGLKRTTHRLRVVFKSLPLTRLWTFKGSQAQVFSQNITTSQKIEALLLGLANSVYYNGCFRLLSLGLQNKILLFEIPSLAIFSFLRAQDSETSICGAEISRLE